MVVFKKTVLPNGIRVVSEFHPHPRAVSLGVWVTTGTRDEAVGEEGLSHLLEHLVFKGTKTRSAYQIARSLEAVGGELNAYTTKEYTCYHSMTLREDWPTALDVLTDLVCNMKVSARDFQLEKGVILQEIAMSEDNHEDIINDLLFERVYRKNPLGTPILGSVKSIVEMKWSKVRERYREGYNGGSIIVSAAGPIDHEALVEAVAKALRTKKKTNRRRRRMAARWSAAREVIEKDGELVHCLWAMPTGGFRDRDRFEAYIVNAALGGGMTSKLYQAVRERKGLVYSIHSSLMTFADAGMFSIYAGADLAKVKEVGEIVAREVGKLRQKGLTNSELDLFKKQLVGGILLGADEVESRMTSLGVNEMVYGKYRSVESVIAEIQAIDSKTFHRFLDERFDPSRMAGIALGPGVNDLADWWRELDFSGGRR